MIALTKVINDLEEQLKNAIQLASWAHKDWMRHENKILEIKTLVADLQALEKQKC